MSLIFSIIVGILGSLASHDTDIGLLISVVISLTLILGNTMYYVKVERIKSRLEIQFRMWKYILLSFIILILNLIINEMIK